MFLLCPDRTQYLHWMEALEGTLINPQALKLCDFSIVTMVGKGSFGQVLQYSLYLASLVFINWCRSIATREQTWTQVGKATKIEARIHTHVSHQLKHVKRLSKAVKITK